MSNAAAVVTVTDDALLAAVSHDLPGSVFAILDETPAANHSVVASGYSNGVSGQVWRALDRGVIRGDADVVDAARDAYMNALQGSLFGEETALLTLDVLGAAGVETRALKGLALSHLDHVDPAERTFGDADILIRRRDHTEALAALIRAGFRRDAPPVRAGWERRFGKAVVLRAPNGGELDLHLAITGGYFGARIDHDELWRTPPAVYELGGERVLALAREDRLLHACCHSVLGGLSGLRTQRDVAHLVLVAGADWRTTVERAMHRGVDLVVAEATRTAWSDLRLDATHPFAVWASEHQADDAQRRARASYRRSGALGWGAEGLGTVAALRPLDRVRFIAGLAVPSKASRRARHRSWPEQVRRAQAVVRWRAHRGEG